jgi:hypothetical protein
MDQQAALYGIKHSNRNFSDEYYWGKNQFNSSFPAALACYMRDCGHSAVYIRHVANRKTEVSAVPFCQVFGSELRNEELYFSFEDVHEPFAHFVHDSLKPIDLILKTVDTKKCIRPLEIKLTVIPDNSTEDRSDADFGAELVVRSPTMRYMAMSMAESCRDHMKDIREIFAPVCATIRHWDVVESMTAKRERIFEALECFIEKFRTLEKPLLMQPIWKTEGKSSVLAEQCLDIFVWSDFALTRLFMDSAGVAEDKGGKITRQQRAALRLARFLFELSSAHDRRVYQEPIYDGMNFNVLNDKEFSISGSKTNQYLRCDRLTRPIISKHEIKKIVLGGGQKLLSPERRFDAILYFSKDLFE